MEKIIYSRNGEDDVDAEIAAVQDRTQTFDSIRYEAYQNSSADIW